MEYPKTEFLVDVVHQSFQEMEAIGIVFVDRVYVAEKHAWTNFRAPDGHLYELNNGRLPGLRGE